MGVVPFAFSVHHFVSSVGADVGFAAIVGLAILVLLYFAQARETANLREQAHEAAQRVEYLEARIAQVARRQAAPATDSSTAAGAAPGLRASRLAGTPARAAFMGPPAGMAAPALAAATRLIPIAEVALPEPAPLRVGSDVAVADQLPMETEAVGGHSGEGARSGIPAAVGVAAGATESDPELTGVAPPQSVRPATFAGAGNGSAGEHGYDTAIVGAGLPRVAERPPSRPLSPTPPRRPLPPPEPPRRKGLRRVGALLAGLAAAAAVAAVLLFVVKLGASPSQSAARPPRPARVSRHTGAFNPATVTVAVLNGTSTPNLAARTSSRLIALGYKKGNVADAAAQTYTATVVAYMPGHRSDALHVARALKLGPSSVQPIDSGTQAVACAQSPCTATVVVTTGADLATQ